MNGAVLWEGETCLPGETGRVAAVITGMGEFPSKNKKTGPMAQVWYIPIDQGPLIGLGGAVLGGRDRAVCGTCKHRPSEGGACYVGIPRGPQRVWYAYQQGRYPRPSIEEICEALRGKAIRFGAYGEPPSIPLGVYQQLLPVLGSWQGYTHVWPQLDVASWGFLMASTDTRKETLTAQAAGWRTFRTRLAGEPLMPSERVCPAAEEAGHALTCLACRQCDGNARGARRPHRVIIVHGFRAARFARSARQTYLFLPEPA